MAACDEASVYASRCSDEHADFARHLQETRGRRGLFVEFYGLSLWGFGHVLYNAFIIHDVCRQTKRYCHIQLYDLNLGKLLGYAEGGQTWGPPSSALLAQYRQAGRNKTVTLSYGKWAFARRFATARPADPAVDLANFLQTHQYRHASFIHVRTIGPMRFDQPSLPFGADLSRGASWSGECPLRRRDRCNISVHHRLTRCFCRFVTEPRFALPPSSPSVTYQLRTGYADIADDVLSRLVDAARRTDPNYVAERRSLHKPCTAGQRYTEMRHWLRAACPTDAAIQALASTHVMTDAPAVRKHMRGLCGSIGGSDSAYGSRSHGGSSSSDGDGDGTRLASTRSWNTTLEMKRSALADLLIGSRSTIAYLGASSFARWLASP